MHKSMTDLSRLFKEFASVCLGNYGGILLSLAINVLLARRLGADGFGHLALFLMSSQVLSFFVVNWTVSALVRFGAQEFMDARCAPKTLWARTALVVPVANYVQVRDLSWRQRYRWAILDTFDMLSPRYDQPLIPQAGARALAREGIVNLKRLNNPGLNLVGERGTSEGVTPMRATVEWTA